MLVAAVCVALVSGCARPAAAATGVPFEHCNQIITTQNPAAGVNLSFPVTDGATWELLAFRTSFVTNGTAGNRTVKFRMITDTFVNAWWEVGSVQTASTTVFYAGQQGSGSQTAVGGLVNMPLPQGMLLTEDMIFDTTVDGMQAGDDWGASAITYCEVTHPIPPASVNVVNTVPVSGASFTATSTCGTPPASVAPSTTTTTQPACRSEVAGFTGDGMAIPVAAGVIVFGLLVAVALLWRYRR